MPNGCHSLYMYNKKYLVHFNVRSIWNEWELGWNIVQCHNMKTCEYQR